MNEPPATCGVGANGLDIDPFGNIKACLHLEETAGNLHDHSVKDIWNNSPLFLRARARAIEAEKIIGDGKREQLGAPVYCLAVEENLRKRGSIRVLPPS